MPSSTVIDASIKSQAPPDDIGFVSLMYEITWGVELKIITASHTHAKITNVGRGQIACKKDILADFIW